MNSYYNNESGPIYPIIGAPVCIRFRTETIFSSKIRYFDAIILIPNIIFILFLIIKWIRMRTKINFSKPLLFSVCCLTFSVAFTNIIRCLYAMIFIDQTSYVKGIILKILWLTVRFSLLSTELSLLFFGIFFGRLNSNRQWLRTAQILILSILVSLIYTIVQGLLEFRGDVRPIIIKLNIYNLYSYGGMKFLLISSSLFLLIYILICFLPHLCQNYRKYLPIRQSFYVYCFSMACINIIQIIGTILNLINTTNIGMCIVDGTTCIFYICFAPFVYHQFLRRAFSTQTLIPQVMYADPTLVNDDDDDKLLNPEIDVDVLLINNSLDQNNETSTIINNDR